MKNNNNKTGIGSWILIIILISSILIGVGYEQNLDSSRKVCKLMLDNVYEERDYLYGRETFYIKELNECNSYLDRFDKYVADLNNQLLLTKENCPICPIDEVCIKVVKENKFQCINREIFGGN